MGQDFTALIQYAGPTDAVQRLITAWEQGAEDPALAEVISCGLYKGFAFAEDVQPACWRSHADYDQTFPERPALPSLNAYLHLPSGFTLTFGRDAVWVYHTLRWLFFLTDGEWQRVMLAAVRRFCELLDAGNCIITNDEHPAPQAVYAGSSFAEALAIASQQGEGEVPTLGNMYREVESDSDLALKPVRGPAGKYLKGQFVKWPRDKPLPAGWSRPTMWDSKGYWRYHWQKVRH
jgi:hypothetical protein